jgi:ribonucleoside-diphosphate reductase beta chain
MQEKSQLIFNTQKTKSDYENVKLFLNDSKGLINTIHKKYPKIWTLYKELKALDWSEDEFNYQQCLVDFKTANKDISDMMIETLAWQWEADSVVSTSPICLIAPFNPSIEVWETEATITTNELVHANTYSEIVRMSFDKPEEVLEQILSKQEAFKRLAKVQNFLEDFAELSYDYQQNKKSYDEKYIIKQLMKYYFVLLLLERIQFMASFAITFTICMSNLFQAIGQAVKKIAQDELEVHCEYRKEILKELKSEYPDVWESVLPEFADLFKEVVESEMTWTEHLFKDRELVGINEDLTKQWVLFNAKDVAKTVGIDKTENMYKFPVKNPIPHLEDWFNMNAQQAAPQEQDVAAYKLNIVKRADENMEFSF